VTLVEGLDFQTINSHLCLMLLAGFQKGNKSLSSCKESTELEGKSKLQWLGTIIACD
jgi:hypothetical protein